jgi:hypothetical protein
MQGKYVSNAVFSKKISLQDTVFRGFNSKGTAYDLSTLAATLEKAQRVYI